MEKRIFYYDTDAGGVVYYGNYLKYLEEARTEFLERKGLGVETFKRHGLFYAVRKCSITYKSPARYGETLICDATLTKITAAQLFFDQKIWDKKNQRMIVEAEVILVALNAEFKPTQIPDDLKALLA
ncbi:MAG: YbgC/FadM family acyl-CoA thioesterase [Candidatus Omnitrophota bacterium]